MVDLLAKGYPLSHYYLLSKEGYVVDVMSWWLGNYGNLLKGDEQLIRKAMDICCVHRNNNQYNSVFSRIQNIFINRFYEHENNIDLLINYASKNDLDGTNIVLTMVAEEKRYLFFNDVEWKILYCYQADSLDAIEKFFKLVPHDQVHLLVTPFFKIYEHNKHIVYPLLKYIGSEYIILFKEMISSYITIDTSVIKLIPESQIHLFQETISNLMIRYIYYSPEIIKDIPESQIFLFKEAISKGIINNGYDGAETIKSIPESQIFLFKVSISNLISDNSYCTNRIIKSIPESQIYLFKNAISNSIIKDLYYADEIIKAIPKSHIYLFKEAISRSIINDPYHANKIIKVIPEDLIYLFKEAISTSIIKNSLYKNETIEVIPKNQIHLFEEIILDFYAEEIVNHINNGAGWLWDNPKDWKLIENTVKKLKPENQIEVINKAANKINSTSRKAILFSFLKEYEKNIVTDSTERDVSEESTRPPILTSLNYCSTSEAPVSDKKRKFRDLVGDPIDRKDHSTRRNHVNQR